MASFRAESFIFLNADQIRQIENLAVSEWGFSLNQLSYCAGLMLALWIRQYLNSRLIDTRILIVAGSGHNGEDGLMAAKWLAGWGAQVAVALTKPVFELGVTHQLFITQLKRMKVPCQFISEFRFDDSVKASDLIVDCMLGIGLKSPARGIISESIMILNQTTVPVICADIPSGMDSDATQWFDCVVDANVTLTFGVLKMGFLNPQAKTKLGSLILADIGLPIQLFEKMNINTQPIFSNSGFLKIDLSLF